MKHLLKYSLALMPFVAMADTVALPPLFSPAADGMCTRAAFMQTTGNPRGVIDQLSLADAADDASRMMLAKAYYDLGDPVCVSMLRNLVADAPASEYADEAMRLIGDWYFFNGEYAEALQNYDKTSFSVLSGDEHDVYVYRKALSQIKIGDVLQARPAMRSLLGNAKMEGPARFYLAYIDYTQGNLDDAYNGFSRSREIEAGYYLAQIDYKRRDYEKASQEALAMLRNSTDVQMRPEMMRIAGESLFRLGEPEEAEIWLTKYVDNGLVTPALDACYTLGVILYDKGELNEAAEMFGRVSDLRSELGQSANLYLGQCAAREGDYDGAAIAFKKAYTTNFDDMVAQTALYNYIASTTRGGKVPFSSSIPLLNEFLTKYPASKYASQVRRYLATAYYNEKDYANALSSINQISNPDSQTLSAKQKILYELGVQMVTSNRPEEAEQYLREAQTLSRFDKKLAAQVDLWLAEACYMQDKYSQAQNAYEQYFKSNRTDANRGVALYNYAYSLYQQDKFKEALAVFDEAMSSGELPAAMRADALIRKADCLYYTGNVNSASSLYEQAMKAGSSDADYAAMRKAVIAGVNGSNAEKVKQLQTMIAAYPTSKWISTALLEMAIAYTEMGDNKNAMDTFERLVKDYPKTPQTRNALLYMAELNAGQGQTDKAIEEYRTIISSWPTSEQAQLANDNLRTIYAIRGELNEYAAWLKGIKGAPQLNPDEIEQATFDAAATAYGREGGTADLLLKYVAAYPDGKYLAQALRNIAQYQYEEQDNAAAALATLEDLLAKRPNAQQVPGALLLKARILEQTSPGHRDILNTYRMLETIGGSEYAAESWAGIMRNTGSPSERIEYARRIRNAGGVSADDLEEAAFYEADGQASAGNRTEAIAILTDLAKHPETLFGARANVALGEIYLADGQKQKAVDLMTAFTESGTPRQYWLARGYITLADAYKAIGKTYLGREYLQSLRDNYPGKEADIFEMIDQRLKTWK